MKAWVWLVLIILTLQVGCAPGYYEMGSSYSVPSPSLTGMTYQNPETPEEQTERIWRESMGR